MAGPIICPVCGESNPADMEFCQNCQSRLLPLTGALKGEDGPIHPGQAPTKKVTSELEPILPAWLREARQQARQSAEEEPTITGEKKPVKPQSDAPDLLAGLASQNENEEDGDETPDWVTGITGARSRKKKTEPESSQVKWVELGHNDEPPPSASTKETPAGPRTSVHPPAPEKDELTEWFKQATGSTPAPAPDEKLEFTRFETPPASPSENSAPLQQPPANSESFSVFRELDTGAPASPTEGVEPALSFDAEIPDWIKKLDSETPAASQQPVPPLIGETESSATPSTQVPDWLKNLGHESAAPQQQPPSARDEALPDWLKTTGPSTQGPFTGQPAPDKPAAFQSPAVPEQGAEPAEMPDWITSLKSIEPQGAAPDEPAAFQSPPATEQGAEPAEMPDWITSLKSIEPQGAAPGEPAAMQSPPATEQGAEPAEMPDWITSLKSTGTQGSEPGKPGNPVFQSDQPSSTEPTSAASAFTESPNAGNDVDAIFASMQIPDWLSDVTLAKPAAEENQVPAAQADESIAPAELPSWVQAMRPVESAMGNASATPQDNRLEESGALAGLHGVLPIIPGATEATSKPKSHSIKLDTTEQQQAHVVLLEQILSAETAPLPMKASSLPRSQRLLRWSLSALLFIVLGVGIFGRTPTPIFNFPSQAPNETNAAMQVVENIPANAPVLVVFDYEPATIGEMEASGASLLYNLRLLKNPRFTLLSTSPTGSALAERFMSNVLATPNSKPPYIPVAGTDYIDLGYLPGGLAGVYAFAQDPKGIMPFDANSEAAWNSKLLDGVDNLSGFKAIIVLTDSVEAGRVWIEQTGLARGATPLVMVASAQAGPMFLPYVQSGQVNGLVSGLYGAAGAEIVTGGLPNIPCMDRVQPPVPAEQASCPQTGFVRRYWDAYNLGIYLVAALMTLGGLWNFWLGIQDRRIHEAG